MTKEIRWYLSEEKKRRKTKLCYHNDICRHSLGKPIDFHWFKISCLTCLVFSCVYCFFLKRWNYIKSKDTCSSWTNRTSAGIFFSQIDVIKVSKIQQIFYYFTENTSMDFRKVDRRGTVFPMNVKLQRESFE